MHFRSRSLLVGLMLSVATLNPPCSGAQQVALADPFDAERAAEQEAAAWAMVPSILEKIRPPSFPDRDCVVTDYGARADSSDVDDRPGILAAMTECAEKGGGRVVLPAGDYLSNGPIHFENDINLHLEEGAVLRFGTNPEWYTPLVLTRWEGVFAYNYSPLLYAYGRENIAVSGRGVIDGQTEGTWSLWKRDNDGKNQETEGNKPRLRRLGAEGVPVEQRIFGNGILDLDGDGVNEGDGQQYYLRPSLLQFMRSRNVLVEGVTFRSSPFWTTHFVECENVTVRGTTILSGTTNDDGIDPDGSQYVLIEDNDIHTYDDAIAIKAGRDRDGRESRSASYIVIRNNRLRSTVGGAMSIGSEMSGGVEWVFIESNVAENRGGHGFYIKSNLDRGGFVRHVYVRDLDVLEAADGFIITSDYPGWRGEHFPSEVHDVFLSDVRVWNSRDASIRLIGHEEAPIRRLALRDVTFVRAAEEPVFREVEDVIFSTVRLNGSEAGSAHLETSEPDLRGTVRH